MKKGMIRSIIRMLIPLNKQSEALEIMGSVITQIQFEPGCVSSRVYRDVDEVRAIMLEELWMCEEDVLRHLRSDLYRRVLLVVEMSEKPPEIRFDTVICSNGVEMIEKARNRGESAEN
ncbi:MAG: putative quinol monooxygenase [Desulfococcaceae bacterium]